MYYGMEELYQLYIYGRLMCGENLDVVAAT